MKILGMETAVGKKPSALTPRIFTEFNQIFLELYGEFEKKKVYEYQTSNYESKGVLKHGDFTLGKVRNWLAYHQLIVVQKLHEPDKQGKMKTVWQLGSTKLGKQAYEHGAVIEVEAHQKTQVGIGKMYPDFDKLWKMCLTQAEVDGVARTRREQWEWQFRDFFILKLAAIQEDNAKAEAMSWVRKLIAESPRKGHRNKLKSMPNYNAVALEGEQLLGTQQSLVDFWPKKYKPKKPLKETPYQNGLRRALVEECERATVLERPKENTAYITIDATLQSQQLGGEFIPYFHTSLGIQIANFGTGSMSGGGGALYNAKHIALSIKHFISEALHYCETFESDRIVARKNIKVEWTERAKTLWKQTVGKKIIPETVFGRTMNIEYAEQLLLKIQPNDTTNVWRGLENYNVQNYETEDCLGSMRHGEALDYCIWLYEKAGKKRKEIISILEKSRQLGFKILYDAGLRERTWNIKQAEEAKDIVIREATRARNREILQSEWLDPHSSVMWRYDWVWHLLDDEANIQKWAKIIGVEYECPDKALEIFEQATAAFESVDINSLPISKKGLGVKSLNETKATEMVTIESHPKQSVPQPKPSSIGIRLAELHEGQIAKYTNPTTKPQFRKGQTIWVENEQRTILATKWCVDGRPEWFYAFEPEGYGGIVQNGKTWQIGTALQEVELSKLTKEEKESRVKGIITELQKDPYTFDVRNWKHGINPTEIKKRFEKPKDYPNVSGSRIFTIFRQLKPYGCTEKQLVDALMLVRKTQLKWHVDMLFNEGNGFYKRCLEQEIEHNKTRQDIDSTQWLENFKNHEKWRKAQMKEADLKYEPYPWAAELLKKYESVTIKEVVVTTIESHPKHKQSVQVTRQGKRIRK